MMDDILPAIQNSASGRAKSRQGEQSPKSGKTRSNSKPGSPSRRKGASSSRSGSRKQARSHAQKARADAHEHNGLAEDLRAATATNIPDNVVPAPHDRKSFCLETLVEGYVNSYVEFFYLTHRATEDHPDLEPDQLELIKKHLTTSETCHRQGDSLGMFKCYKKIADHYFGTEDYTTAVYFYEKCLEISVMTNDLARQSLANHKLGVAFHCLGDIVASIRFHERHLELARENDDLDGAKEASNQLVSMYSSEADELEQNGREEEAVDCLAKCLDAAVTAEDPQAEGTANHRLGLAMIRLGDADTALQYEQNYLQLCQEINDVNGEANAYAALAQAYRLNNQNASAIENLKKFLQIATKNDSKESQARACAELGSIYRMEADHDRAVEYLERNYNIARCLGDRHALNQARIELGTARAHKMFSQFLGVVNDDIGLLLRWKTNRSGLDNA